MGLIYKKVDLVEYQKKIQMVRAVDQCKRLVGGGDFPLEICKQRLVGSLWGIL